MGEQKANKKKRAEYDIPPEKFIEVWQTSNSAEEAAKKLDMPKAILHARASTYRNMGIKLKKMPRPNKGLDIENLNKFVEEVDKKRGATTAEPKKRGTTPTLDQADIKEIVKQVVQETTGKKGK